MPRDYTGRELSHANDFILIMKLIHNPFQYAVRLVDGCAITSSMGYFYENYLDKYLKIICYLIWNPKGG